MVLHVVQINRKSRLPTKHGFKGCAFDRLLQTHVVPTYCSWWRDVPVLFPVQVLCQALCEGLAQLLIKPIGLWVVA